MSISLKPLDEQVMVITGASSGIGLATATLAVENGASVVLVARSGETLEAIAAAIEEEGGQAPVSVTLIQPTATDTPFPQHARNYMDREPKLPTPQLDPYDVAETILEAATDPQRHRKVGMMARLNAGTAKAAPPLADRMAARQAGRQQYDEPPRDRQGALHAAGGRGRITGVGGREA